MYVDEGTAQRLKEENKIRAPLIKKITDAAPMFRGSDFESWTTDRIADLAERVKREAAQILVHNAYELMIRKVVE
jgi:hypothetical protein